MGTPSHVDLSVLWVPIMPETSKLGPAMEDAGKSATESFDKGSSFGEKIHDSFSKATGKVKDVFSHAGSDAGKAMSDSFEKETKGIEDAAEDAGKKATGKFGEAAKNLGGALIGAIGPETKSLLGNKIEEVVGDAVTGVIGDFGGKWSGKLAHSVFDFSLNDLQTKLGDVKDVADKTKQAFADLTGGNTLAGVQGLADGFKTVGLEVSDLPQPIQDVIGQTTEFQNSVKGAADMFADMPGKIGAVGTAIGELSGPIGIMVAGVAGAIRGLQAIRDQSNGAYLPMPPGADPQKWHDLISGGNNADIFPPGSVGSGTLGDLLGDNPGDAPSGTPGPGREPHGPAKPFYQDWYPDTPDSGGLPGSGAPSGFTPSSSAPAPRDVGSDKGLTPTSSEVKRVVSTLFPQINDIGGWRPPDGYNEHSSGQALDVMIPNWDTPQGQALGSQIKDYVTQHAKELGVDYALWQQTQWNPGGGKSPMENRGDPNQNHFTHVHIHTTRGGGDGGDLTDMAAPGALGSSGVGGRGASIGGDRGAVSGPSGAQHDPIYTAQADAGTGGAGGSSSEDQAKQLGSGLVNGVLQEFGLDGSVFKSFGGSSNPLHFGITKLATGLINSFGGMLGGQTQGGDGASLGGLGGGGGSILPGLGSLIPHPAAGAVPIGPGGAQNVNGGDTHIYGNAGPTLNVTQNGVQSPTPDLQETANGAGNRMPAMGTAPNSGNLPSTP